MDRLGRVCFGSLACLSLLSFNAVTAHAENTWQAPSDCQIPLAQQENRTQHPETQVRIWREGSSWHASVRAAYDGGVGERILSAMTCAEVVAAVEVALSLIEGSVADLPQGTAPHPATAIPPETPSPPVAVTSDTATQSSEPSLNDASLGNGSLGTASADETPSASPRPRTIPPRTRPRPKAAQPDPNPTSDVASPGPGRLHLAALATLGGTNWLAVGAAAAAQWHAQMWSTQLQVAGQWLPTQHTASGVDVEMRLGSAWLDVCKEWRATLEVDLCASAQLNLLLASTPNLAQPRSDYALIPGLGAALGVNIPLSQHWLLSGSVRGEFRARRVHLDVEPWGSVYEFPRFGGSVQFGPTLSL